MPAPVGEVGLFQVDESAWDEVKAEKVGRASPIDGYLREIRNSPQVHGKPIGLVQYEGVSQARGMLNGLKSRIGPPEASGFQFQVRTNGPKYAVVAIYDGSKITKDGQAIFARENEVRLAKAREANEKAKAKAKAEKSAANGKAAETAADSKATQPA